MKKYGNIYSKIYSINNLRFAHQNVKEDKSYYKEVQIVDNNEKYLYIKYE